ncbi:MAG: dTDP-4-dehydrorhamnose 3,5-epimerase [bacterium]
MLFRETKLNGVFVIDVTRFNDERGFFAPSFSAKEFVARGLASNFVENNISYSKNCGTLRGMHFQAAPYGQQKLVRCTRGAIFDVVIDLRPQSPTFTEWVSVQLNAENRSMLYVPGDCAHGFQTLVDDTEVFYLVSQPYVQESGRGVRWDDPAFAIDWPDVTERTVLKRDREYPDFTQ